MRVYNAENYVNNNYENVKIGIKTVLFLTQQNEINVKYNQKNNRKKALQ